MQQQGVNTQYDLLLNAPANNSLEGYRGKQPENTEVVVGIGIGGEALSFRPVAQIEQPQTGAPVSFGLYSDDECAAAIQY